MATFGTLTTTLLFSSATGLISAYLAHRRGRNPLIWFFVGFFFGMLGMLFLFFAPNGKKEEPIPIAPEPHIAGPADKFWYYLDPNHAQVGPMSHRALSDNWKQEKITEETLVWNEEMTEWKPLKDLVKE